MLVGVPLFRVPDLVRSCLSSLVGTPATVLAIDNASDSDVKEVLQEFPVTVVSNSSNKFCNGAWNQILEHGISFGYAVIGLGSSDAALHPGWYEAITSRFEEHPKEILVPSVREPVLNPDYHKATHPVEGVAGYFMFMTREAAQLVYPIPHTLKMWYGDEYIFSTLIKHGWKVAVLEEVGAYHQQGSITYRTPEAYEAIEQDKRAWKDLA